MPMAAGSPKCTGVPWVSGKRLVISMARMASAGRNGRIDTPMVPANGPQGTSGMSVRYMGTHDALGVVAQFQPVGHQRILE